MADFSQFLTSPNVGMNNLQSQQSSGSGNALLGFLGGGLVNPGNPGAGSIQGILQGTGMNSDNAALLPGNPHNFTDPLMGSFSPASFLGF